MKVKFITLGCKVNQYETQALREQFARAGFESTEEKADIYVINTCTVTATADTKSKEAILKAKRENSSAKVAACGCMAQLNADELKSLGVDYIVPQDKKQNLVDYISNDAIGSRSIWDLKISDFENRRAFVKIQDGCDNLCSFCKIPYLRGTSHSRNKNDIIEEIRRLSDKHREIVLCGVNLGLYGKDLRPPLKLSGLLADILKIESLGRIRLSSLEPSLIDDDLLSMLKEPKVCPHLHLPFQSGNDKILKLMNKKETVDVYRNVVRKSRKIIPSIAISCDIMVGFPNEEDDDFNSTVNFLKKIRPMRMHIFRFSPREKTPFSNFKIRNHREIKERAGVLKEMKDKFSREYRSKFIGKNLTMVAEEKRDGYCAGYSENYIRVYVKEGIPPGSFAKVEVYAIDGEKTFAKVNAA